MTNPGSGDGATMPPPPPEPSGYAPATFSPPGYVLSDIPAQQGEFLGRILDPVRAAALHEAVETVSLWPEDRLDPDRILEVAERFEAWLERDWVGEHPPGKWFTSDPSVGPHRFSPVQGTRRYCLLFTGPNTICGKEQDDPVHQGEAP